LPKIDQRHESLLGAVVQVALDPPPFVVARLQDAVAGGDHLVQLSPDLGVQPLVLDGHPGRGGRRGDQAGVQRPIVDEGGQWRTERADQRDRPVWTVGRPDTRQSIRVDPPARWRWRLPRFGTA
jgi:hypothetical protein